MIREPPAGKLARLMAESEILDKMSERAIRKTKYEFSVGKMVAEYPESTLLC